MNKKIAAALILSAIFVQPIFAQDINVFVNDNLVEFTNQQPIIVDGRTLIPLRGVFENLGYDVSWDQNTKTATLVNGTYTISIQSGSQTFTVDSEEKTLDVPAQITNGSMMIPLRAIGEAANAEVEWDADTKSAKVISSDTQSVDSDSDDLSPGGWNLKVLTEVRQYGKALYETVLEPLTEVTDYIKNPASVFFDISDLGDRDTLQKYISIVEKAKDDISKLDPPSMYENTHNLIIQSLDFLNEKELNFMGELLDKGKDAITDEDYEKLTEYHKEFVELFTKFDSARQSVGVKLYFMSEEDLKKIQSDIDKLSDEEKKEIEDIFDVTL